MTDATADQTPQPRGSGWLSSRGGNWPGEDLYSGFRAWRVWSKLGWNDIQQRYRRSVLGPFWMTLSMGVLVLALGVLYGRIFHQDLHSYLPFIALGFIVWGFISSTITEGCGAFTDGEAIIKQIRIPFSMFVLRVVWRNFIVLLHTIILIIPIWIVLGISPGVVSVLALPGIVLVFANLVWIGIVVAVFSTRFRDVPLIVQTALQIGMFATPIMWPIDSLGGHTLVADINPVYHLLQLVRAPLMGQAPEELSWAVSVGLLVVGYAIAILCVHRSWRRIVYWL